MLLGVMVACDSEAAAPTRGGPATGSSAAAQTLGVLSSPSIPSTPRLTDAENLRTAERESERTLGLAPLPPGARPIPGQPRGWPPDAGFGMSPADSSLTRTEWYSVPLSADAVQQFLLRHHPRGMAAEKDEGVGSSTGVRTFDYQTVHPRDPAAYTSPSLLVEWFDVGPSTAIRFDVMLASRRARPQATLLTGGVASVDIDRIRNHLEGAGSSTVLSTVRLSAESEPAVLGQVVAALNGLYGDAVSNSMHSCLFQSETTTYRFVFHIAAGDVTYQWANPCDPQIDVTRAGKSFGPSLDPGDLYDRVTTILADSQANGSRSHAPPASCTGTIALLSSAGSRVVVLPNRRNHLRVREGETVTVDATGPCANTVVISPQSQGFLTAIGDPNPMTLRADRVGTVRVSVTHPMCAEVTDPMCMGGVEPDGHVLVSIEPR
jgi:hypothetical protein